MQIRVVYTAQARVVAGCDDQSVALSGDATILDLLQTLTAEGPADLRGFLFRGDNQIQPTLMIVLNDLPVSRGELSTTALTDGDVVTIVPPLAGG